MRSRTLSAVTACGPVTHLLELWLLSVVTGLLGGLVVGIALAVVGLFHWFGVVLPGVVSGTLILRFARPRLAPSRTTTGSSLAVMAMVGVVILLTGVSVLNPGEHLWTGRDPATYLATAGWLAESGSLIVDARSGPFAEEASLRYAVNGFYERPDGRLSPQFFHAFPVALATVGQVLGLDGMLPVNAVIGGIGLMALFALTARLIGAWGGLIVVLLLGLNPVFVYFTRVPVSEPLALLFLAAGFWLLLARHDGDVSLGLVAGGLLGAAVMARVDSLLVVIPLLAVVLLGQAATRRAARPVLRGFVLLAAFGLVEAMWISPWYIGQLDAELLVIGIGILVVVALSIFGASAMFRLRRWTRERRRLVANVVTTSVISSLLFGLFLRPRLGISKGSVYDVASIQIANQLPIQPDRTYAELTLHWLLWYLGPIALALGFAGLIVLIRGSINRGLSWPTILWLSTVGLFAGAYLWRPSINPDQIWAMRRFLPVVFPALAIGVALAVRIVAESFPRSWGGAFASAAAVAAVIGVATAYVDVWDLHEFDGLSADFQTACEEVGEDGAVLIVETPESELAPLLMQGFRSYCHVPAAAADSDMLPALRIPELASNWEGVGRRLVLVSAPGMLDFLGAVPTGSLFAEKYPLLEYTLTRRPTEVVSVEGRAVFGVMPAETA